MLKNRRLSKALSDASLSEFHRQLEYKAEWYGATLAKADRFYPSSKRCSRCGHSDRFALQKCPLGRKLTQELPLGNFW